MNLNCFLLSHFVGRRSSDRFVHGIFGNPSCVKIRHFSSGEIKQLILLACHFVNLCNFHANYIIGPNRRVSIVWCQIYLLVSAGYLCNLQGLFSEINDFCRVNCNEFQLLSSYRHDVVMSQIYTWRRVFEDTNNL